MADNEYNMEQGTSTGLMIIVGVVIFGIFVAVAYMLLRDKLNPELGTMFDDALAGASGALGKK